MRSDAYIRATCDNCGGEEEIELTKLARRGEWDERSVDSYLDTYGWITEGDSDYCCEDCHKEGAMQ